MNMNSAYETVMIPLSTAASLVPHTDDYMSLSLFLPKQYPSQILYHALPAQLSQMCCVEFV